MSKLTFTAALLCGAFALSGAAQAQGTITPPASATGQSASGGANTNNSGVSGTVAGPDKLYGNIGSSESERSFDPSSLHLGKTATPMKGIKNMARVEANERRITQQLNKAAAAGTAQNPG